MIELLELSVAVHVTTFIPTGNEDGAFEVNVTLPQLSLATGVPIEPTKVHPLLIVTYNVGGQTIVGKILSATVTFCCKYPYYNFGP